MPIHHPNENLLAEFEAGSLAEAPAMAVRAHLHYCANCRSQLEQLRIVGGELLSRAEPASMPTDAFDKLLSRLDELEPQEQNSAIPLPAVNTTRQAVDDEASRGDMPSFLYKLAPSGRSLDWRKLTRSLSMAALKTGQRQHQVSLYKIFAGGKSFKHDHRGAEYTVVLTGSFSDEDGVYKVGDFLLREPGEVHLPIAASNENCLCFAVEEAPIALTGWLGFLLNPFIKLNPA